MIICANGKKILSDSEKKELLIVQKMGGEYMSVHYMNPTFVRVYKSYGNLSSPPHVATIHGHTADTLGELLREKRCTYYSLADIIKEYCSD